MPKKTVLSFLVVLLAAGLSACTVMQSTYQKKADEAESLARRVAVLEKRTEVLSAENDALRSELSAMTQQGEKLSTDLAYVAGQRDKLAADLEELDSALKDRSDALLETISDLRRRVAELEAEVRRIGAGGVPKE